MTITNPTGLQVIDALLEIDPIGELAFREFGQCLGRTQGEDYWQSFWSKQEWHTYDPLTWTEAHRLSNVSLSKG